MFIMLRYHHFSNGYPIEAWSFRVLLRFDVLNGKTEKEKSTQLNVLLFLNISIASMSFSLMLKMGL